MAGKEQMKKLQAERERIKEDIEALTNQLKGLERAISLLSGDEQTVSVNAPVKQRGRNVKETVISVVQSAGADGINAVGVVENAKTNLGIHLDRGSVSSLLSRLKKEGVFLMHPDGGKYFVPQTQIAH